MLGPFENILLEDVEDEDETLEDLPMQSRFSIEPSDKTSIGISRIAKKSMGLILEESK